MKRTGKQIIIDAFTLIKEDLRENRIALLAILLYFLCAKLIFHVICPMVLVTGLPCPACGLTRAGVALLCGHFAETWKIHPFIYVFGMLVLTWGTQRYILRKRYKWMKWVYMLVLIALILFYVIRMILFFPGEPPMSFYHNNMFSILTQMLLK